MTINVNNMPRMGIAFRGWKSTITLNVVTQTNVDGFIQNTATSVTFKGVVQPLKPQEIQLKPEGQRSYEWLQIHAVAGSLNLTTNDRVVYNGRTFKVMMVKDYSQNGYIEYHAIKDYEDGV